MLMSSFYNQILLKKKSFGVEYLPPFSTLLQCSMFLLSHKATLAQPVYVWVYLISMGLRAT